jgi:hypothetical protein
MTCFVAARRHENQASPDYRSRRPLCKVVSPTCDYPSRRVTGFFEDLSCCNSQRLSLKTQHRCLASNRRRCANGVIGVPSFSSIPKLALRKASSKLIEPGLDGRRVDRRRHLRAWHGWSGVGGTGSAAAKDPLIARNLQGTCFWRRVQGLAVLNAETPAPNRERAAGAQPCQKGQINPISASSPSSFADVV